MKVAIVGSRNYIDYENFKEYLFNLISLTDESEIVSGGARGTDAMAKQLAKERNIKYTEFPADWEKYGKKAGYIRNNQIAKYSDICIAFLLGKSKGTRITVKEFKRLDKLVFEIPLEELIKVKEER